MCVCGQLQQGMDNTWKGEKEEHNREEELPGHEHLEQGNNENIQNAVRLENTSSIC